MPHATAGTLATLAQTGAATSSSIADVGLNPFRLFFTTDNRLDILGHPDQLLTQLGQLHVIWAGIFVIVGLMSVVNGYRWHRYIVLTVAFFCGIALGFALSKSMQAGVIVAACMGVLAAVVAWPLMKYAVAICGGLAGAFVGANAWTAVSMPADMHYAGALIGLVAIGLLSFILHQVVIVAMTCVAGAVVLVMGAVTLLMQIDSWGAAMRTDFVGNPIVLPLLVLVTAVIGFVLQQDSYTGAAAKPGGSSGSAKPSGKPAVA